MESEREKMSARKLQEQLDLGAVLTVPEIVERWGKSRKAVLMRIYRDSFTARKSCNTWLVHAQSVISAWGLPPNESEDF